MKPNIWAVKDAVRIEDVARDHDEFKPTGAGRLVGRCLSPDHEDRTPSTTIYVEEQRFKCFGCGAHGDVLDLVMLVEGCELHEAMMLLSNRYGIELPGRPESWHRKQKRQRAVRDELDRLRVEVLQRRLYRIMEPVVLAVEDGELREAVARDVWAALGRQAERMAREYEKGDTPWGDTP